MPPPVFLTYLPASGPPVANPDHPTGRKTLMKASKPLSMVSLAVLCAGTAWAQDPVKVDPTHYKVVLENSSVRLLKIDYAPGSKSTMHQHPDSIVIPFAASRV